MVFSGLVREYKVYDGKITVLNKPITTFFAK